MSIVKQLLGESNATAFKPERIEAWINELQSGKKILVLTATGAELVQSREDVRQFYDQPHVAFYVRPEIISANYGGTTPQSPQSSSQSVSGTAASPAP